jgi:UDP-2-acetamido-3-amino-2,3-dideoxy-glucuronate N-acetyltransferase
MEERFYHEMSIIETDDIGSGTKIWAFSHISKGVKIGKNCTIGEGVHVGPNVAIGDNVKIQNHSLIYEGVTIEDDVFIGPNVVTTNDFYPRISWDKSDKNRFRKTTIKRGSNIGANVTIVCGVTINENALVGAGSVVTKDVEKNNLVFGNPAKFVRLIT